jgi:hypothetical protein
MLEKDGVKPTKGRDGKLAKTLQLLMDVVGELPPQDMTRLLKDAVEHRNDD